MIIMDEFISFVQNVGFPSAIVVYLLYERTKFNNIIVEKLERITAILDRL